MRVEPGQLRQWNDGSGTPFTILAVDRSSKSWNVKNIDEALNNFYVS